MKAPGGCENLKAQAVGRCRPDHSCRCSGREDAVGAETSREALLVGARIKPGVEFSANPESSQWRLGAWAASEEEPKPMRGTRELFNGSRGPGA